MAEVETTATSSAVRREADGSVAEAALPSSNVEQQGRGQETAIATPVTTHSALLGVKNAIDASYVSSRRHLSRRV